jgi:signal peptidase I
MDPVRVQPLSRDRAPRAHFDTHTSETPSSHPPTHNEPQKQESFLGEIFKFAVLALVIVIPFRMFIAQPFIVSGASMSPTFESGQYLIIDQLSYRFDQPSRGEVIIFRFPEDTSKFFIKRVIGLPGETVELRGTDVIIKRPFDGSQLRLDEPYLRSANLKDDFLTITLDTNEYFVMGDNRSASSDSRVWGAVTDDLIVGRAFVRLLPIAEASLYPGSFDLRSPVTD